MLRIAFLMVFLVFPVLVLMALLRLVGGVDWDPSPQSAYGQVGEMPTTHSSWCSDDGENSRMPVEGRSQRGAHD